MNLKPVDIQNPTDFLHHATNRASGAIGMMMDNMGKSVEARELRRFTPYEYHEMLGANTEKDKQQVKKIIRKMGLGERAKNNHILLSFSEVESVRDVLIDAGKHELLKGKRQDPNRETFILSIMNYKGGVGKSTTAINLAHYLAQKGYRILYIDTDPQGSSNYFFGIVSSYDLHDPENQTLFNLLTKEDTNQAMRDFKVSHTHWPNIDYVPSHAIVHDAASAMRDQKKDWALINKINNLGAFEDYDLVIYDTAPSNSNITAAIAYASHGILIPVFPSSPTLWSIRDFYHFLCETFREAEEATGRSQIRFMKMLPTLFSKSKTDTTIRELDALKAIFNTPEFEAVYPVEMYRRSGIAECNMIFSTVYEVLGEDLGLNSNQLLNDARKMLGDVFELIEQDIIKHWPIRN